MNNLGNGYSHGAPRSGGGRLSASTGASRPRMQRPSTEDLAPYSVSNYTKRGLKAGRRQSKHRHTVAIAVTITVVLLLVIPGAMLVASARQATSDAKTLMNQGSALVSQIQSGDVRGAQRTATNLSSIAKKLDENINSLLWAPLVLVPVYGNDVRSIRTLASVADELSEQVLIPVTSGLPTDGSARIFVDGGFNIPMIQAVLNPIGSASETIQGCAQRVNKLGDSHIAELQGPTEAVKQLIGMLAEISGYAGDLSQLLPALFGADGPRTYLVIACSESELRSIGGFPGSAGLLTLDNGKMSIGELEAPRLPYAPDGIDYLPTTEEEKTIFGTRVGRYFYDTGYIPNFPRAAEIMKAIWDANDRPAIDGIVSVDPIFLQSVLGLTGGIATSDGTVVDETNAAEMLMNAAYIMFSTESFEEEADDHNLATARASTRQDAFFSEVASLALDSFFEKIGSANILKTAQTLGDSIADKRIYMWMVNPEEQALIERLDAACAISISETEPELGVYLATTIATKGNWYLDVETTYGDGKVNPDGSTSYVVTTRVTNTISPDQVGDLPALLTSRGYNAMERMQLTSGMVLDVYLFAPVGGKISDLKAEGQFAPEDLFDVPGVSPGWYTRPGAEPMTVASYNGREVWYGVTVVEPSQSTTFTYTVTTSPDATDSLKIDTTPLGQRQN